jgi:hypothetical protein
MSITVPSTADRVRHNTEEAVNRRIEAETGARIRRCAGNPHEIDRRLRELDREWDIERVLETNASLLAFAGVTLGALVNRRFLWLPAAVTAFLFQHAVQGWCPPIPILRRLGIRTAREIEVERVALKILRGDFRDLPSGRRGQAGGAEEAIRAARA